MRDSVYSIVVKVLIAFIIMSNIMVLSYVFLYPRLVFMVTHWGASEREILLSEGPRDNPNMEHLRKVYKLMYFVKDHSEEDSMIYFINPLFSESEAYKILLPRRVEFVDSLSNGNLLTIGQEPYGGRRYLVFRKESIPPLVEQGEIIWYEEGWGIWRIG